MQKKHQASYPTMRILEAMQTLQPWLRIQHLAKLLLRFPGPQTPEPLLQPSSPRPETWKLASGRALFELYEERHTLSIPNLFFQSFDADVAC